MSNRQKEEIVGVEQPWRQVTIVQIEIAGFTQTHAFDDFVQLLQNSFESLGISARIAVNQFSTVGVNVVIGANVLTRLPESLRPELPKNTVIFNLDQVHPASPWMEEYYLSLLRAHPVWDYSSVNIARLAEHFGIHRTALVKIGHMPVMSRIESVVSPDIDVLFYGNLSPRRAKILMDFTETGINLVGLTGVYGKERDIFIARAKLILNLQYYDFPGISEIVRLSYLLSNRKAIVTESGDYIAIESDVEQCVVPARYEDLVETCVKLCRDDAARKRIENRGYVLFSRRNQGAFLSEAIRNTAINP
ncbi:MAG: hypothetical protein E7813_22025 [Bradyrhizobium sp.]|uniref:hypothetical protein n=1 Tax=Bradyrhizobium sp. TaxID=376 RepID=UPI00120953A9|nr:hypothetical protein [Bradyrhizobium sp.]THD61175.1 MAG: hypothetical protein E7813_22025 [Bradyrhizobium sp.]